MVLFPQSRQRNSRRGDRGLGGGGQREIEERRLGKEKQREMVGERGNERDGWVGGGGGLTE